MEEFDDTKKSTDQAYNRLIGAIESKRQLINDAAEKIRQGFSELKVQQDLLVKENGGIDVDDEDLLEINAGGQIVAATRKTLTRLVGTRLEALFSGRWEKKLLRDRNGRVFLDVNASCFRSIVDYLNELGISSPEDPPDPPHVDEGDEIFLGRLLTVFGMDEGLGIPIDSVILKDRQLCLRLHGFLDEDNIDGSLELLYRGSRDGFDASSFHTNCDNKGPTVTVIKSTEGFVFGGFTDKSWSSAGGWNLYHRSSKAFLFALKSHSRIGPTKMRVKTNEVEDAVLHTRSSGPCFGRGPDLQICNNSNANVSSCLNIGSTYSLPAGQTKNFITGNENFQVEEIEVFGFGNTKRNLVQSFKKTNVSLVDCNEEWSRVTFDEFQIDIKTVLDEEKKALIETNSILQQQVRAFEREKHFVDTFATGESEDIVQFNVSGEHMAVKRSTLGLCRDSVLAKQFDDPLWKQNGNLGSVEHWDFEQVATWASETKNIPDEVTQKLSENKIKGYELLLFGRDDLKEIGITRPGTLATVIGAINELKNSALGNVILVEQSAYCFGKMIDQLRLRAMSQPDEELPPEPEIREPDKKRFKRIVEYYFPGDEASSFIIGPPR